MNILLRFHAVVPHLTSKFLAEVFPHHFMENLPYNSVQPYHCIHPNCGRLMSHSEMFPPDRLSPRAICPQCWTKMTSDLYEECWVCGEYLEEWRWKNQKTQPRDIHYRIHGSYCADYFSIISAKALGQDMSFLNENCGLDHQTPQYIDVEYEGVPQKSFNQSSNALPAISNSVPKALPPPQQQMRFRVDPTYRGKKITKVFLNR